jgi:PDZ domain-containing protein
MPLNKGFKAPGITVPVEPMVQVPSRYLYESKGKMILTTVIHHAPILVAEWIYAQFENSVEIVPEEEIISANETIQSKAEKEHYMLISSATLAIAEGLQLAGFQVTENYDGVIILSILPDSPSSSLLITGDIISGINRQQINTIKDLEAVLQSLEEGEVVQLRIIRENTTIKVTTITMPSLHEGGSVRLGVSAETHLAGFTFPFPVTIAPEKILGGPSAGLMFSLGVYDLVTPGDLTGGRCIAGTGTIDIEGNVGSIGSVKQKVVAAQRAGAEYFLCPVENYEDAQAVAKTIKVIQVSTALEAIIFLNTLSPVV